MAYGYTGKILICNLTDGTFAIEQPDDIFYRQYLGGAGIGAYYALREIKPGCDPLGPENVLIFAASVITGAPGPAIPRYTVCAKSPLTGAIGKSEAGGWWGPELKKAGFDAVVIKGTASRPLYLQIEDGQYELRDASHLWGRTTDECQEMLLAELGRGYRIAQIGPGSENRVLYGNIVNELAHFNGRNGLGAVMGAKRLKAIAVRGSGKVACADEEYVRNLTRWVAANFKQHPLAYGLHKAGTAGGLLTMNAAGALPTRHWTENTFEQAGEIGAEKLEEILIQRKGCYSCPIRCKRVVRVERPDLQVDPRLGGPEYETLVMLGSNLGIGDIEIIAKANELCNKYTLDTISFGMTLGFAMECWQRGLLTEEHTGGLKLEFGNKEILLPLIEMTARRQGFGEKLALGSVRLARWLGPAAEQLLLQVKGQEVPAHDPRIKNGVGLQYALSSNGADHFMAQHDHLFQEADSIGLKSLAPLGILKPVPAEELSPAKVRMVYYTHLLTLLYDCLGVCLFGVVARSILPLDRLVELVRAVTGWNTSLWELLKAAERVSLMLRVFNQREGLNREADVLPKRLLQPLATGPWQGQKAIDEEKFRQAVELFYQMAGYDRDGRPLPAKLYELDLDYLVE